MEKMEPIETVSVETQILSLNKNFKWVIVNMLKELRNVQMTSYQIKNTNKVIETINIKFCGWKVQWLKWNIN